MVYNGLSHVMGCYKHPKPLGGSSDCYRFGCFQRRREKVESSSPAALCRALLSAAPFGIPLPFFILKNITQFQ